SPRYSDPETPPANPAIHAPGPVVLPSFRATLRSRHDGPTPRRPAHEITGSRVMLQAARPTQRPGRGDAVGRVAVFELRASPCTHRSQSMPASAHKTARPTVWRRTHWADTRTSHSEIGGSMANTDCIGLGQR